MHNLIFFHTLIAGAQPAPKKRKANAYKMPDPLPLGEVLTDIRKKQWSLGQSVGKGGFGEIYLGMFFNILLALSCSEIDLSSVPMYQ